MIRLHHGGAGGHSTSLLIALAEKGLDHGSEEVDLAAFAQHDPAFLKINPSGQLPVLEEDGRTLTETFFILLYLNDRYPEPQLGGATPQERYAVQRWGKYVESHIAPNLAIVNWAKHGDGLGDAARAGFDRLPPERKALWNKAVAGFSDDEVAAAAGVLARAAGLLSDTLVRGLWLAGDAYSLADIAVFPHVARFASLGLPVSSAIADWLGRMHRRPAVRAALDSAGSTVATMGPEVSRWG
jgi:glutathione S-transferase